MGKRAQMKKRKWIPAVISGLLIIIASAGIWIARTAERKQEKPRVLAAMAEMISRAADKRYSLEGLWQLWDSGRMEYRGKLALLSIEEAWLPQEYQMLLPMLRHAELSFLLKKDDNSRKAVLQAEASRSLLALRLEGYLDDTECLVRVPELYEGTISFSPDNLREQYETSLLCKILGEQKNLPSGNLTDYVFQDFPGLIREEQKTLNTRLLDRLADIRELYDEIEVERIENMASAGSYKDCQAYRLILPADAVNSFLSDAVWENTGHAFILEGEKLPLTVYLDRSNQMTGLTLSETEVSADGKSIPVQLSILFYGTADYPWDKLQIDAAGCVDDIWYRFILLCDNEFSDSGRAVRLKLSLTEPYVMKLCELDMDYAGATGEVMLDVLCRGPMLSFDGELAMKPLEETIKKPEKDAVRIFELSLLEAWSFADKIHWDFFKNQE